MPEGTRVDRLERWENQASFMPYAAQKQSVMDESGWTAEEA